MNYILFSYNSVSGPRLDLAVSEQREKDRSFIGRRRAALRRAESAEIEPPHGRKKDSSSSRAG